MRRMIMAAVAVVALAPGVAMAQIENPDGTVTTSMGTTGQAPPGYESFNSQTGTLTEPNGASTQIPPPGSPYWANSAVPDPTANQSGQPQQ